MEFPFGEKKKCSAVRSHSSCKNVVNCKVSVLLAPNRLI